MPNLFGIDIAAVVKDAFAGQLVSGTLTRVTPGTRTPGALTGGENPTTTAHTFDGVYEEFTASQIDGELVRVGDRKVIMIAGTISPAAVPDVGDQITLEGDVTRVVRVSRDPAAASYTCHVRES